MPSLFAPLLTPTVAIVTTTFAAPEGTSPYQACGIRLETLSRCAAVTGPILAVLSVSPFASWNAAVTVA